MNDDVDASGPRDTDAAAAGSREQWIDIAALPPPGERPGKVWVLVEGHQHHSGTRWFRRMAGLARTHNEGFEVEDIRRIEEEDHMDHGSGGVTHWLPIELPLFPPVGGSRPKAVNPK